MIDELPILQHSITPILRAGEKGLLLGERRMTLVDENVEGGFHAH